MSSESLPFISNEALRALALGAKENHPITNLEELGVTQRMLNLFEKHGIEKIGDLLQKRSDDLLAFPNFGKKQLTILFESLANYHTLPDQDY